MATSEMFLCDPTSSQALSKPSVPPAPTAFLEANSRQTYASPFFFSLKLSGPSGGSIVPVGGVPQVSPPRFFPRPSHPTDLVGFSRFRKKKKTELGLGPEISP